MSEQTLPAPSPIVKIENGDSGVTYREVPGASGYAVGDDGSVWSTNRKKPLDTRHGEAKRLRDEGFSFQEISTRLGFTSGASVFKLLRRASRKTLWKRLVPWLNRGYCIVSIADVGKIRVHRLVLMAFVGAPPLGTEACHNNGIRHDNRSANLRWDTCRGNQADKKRHGTENIGERNGMAVLSDGDVVRIRRLAATGVNDQFLSSQFGVSQSSISMILTGVRWPHSEGPIMQKRKSRKLNIVIANEIRRRLLTGEACKALSSEFNIALSMIYEIKNNRKWKTNEHKNVQNCVSQ